jgi:chromate transporter
VTKRAWLTGAEFTDGLALSQVTPGPVIVTATFIGYKLGGVLGAVFATVCVFLPSSLLLVLLAPQVARLRRVGGGQARPRPPRRLRGHAVLRALAGRPGPLTFGLALGSIAALWFKPNPLWIVLGAVGFAVAFGR